MYFELVYISTWKFNVTYFCHISKDVCVTQEFHFLTTWIKQFKHNIVLKMLFCFFCIASITGSFIMVTTSALYTCRGTPPDWRCRDVDFCLKTSGTGWTGNTGWNSSHNLFAFRIPVYVAIGQLTRIRRFAFKVLHCLYLAPDLLEDGEVQNKTFNLKEI